MIAGMGVAVPSPTAGVPVVKDIARFRYDLVRAPDVIPGVVVEGPRERQASMPEP